MNNSVIFSKAHALTKATIKTGDNYAVTFAAALKTVITESKVSAEIYIVEFRNAWTGNTHSKEVVASSHKEAILKFESENSQKATYVFKKAGEPVAEIVDAEDILFQMDIKGVDFIKFKTTRNMMTVTRKQVEAYINYKNSVARISRFKAAA